MNNELLDQQLRDYYTSQALSSDKVNALLETGQWIDRPRRRWPARILAIVAAVAVVAGSLFLVERMDSRGTTGRAAVEVAKNHAKQIAPEIHSASYKDIARGLDQLDFSIEPERKEMLAGLQVKGGRYCSIQGEMAAQISLTDASGKPCTLYIAPLQGPVERIREAILQEGNVTVRFWRDNGRLFALAR